MSERGAPAKTGAALAPPGPAPSPAGAKRRRSWPLGRLLGLVLATLVVVTAASVIAFTWGASLRNTFDLLNARSVDMVEGLRGALNAHLLPAEALIFRTAAAVADGRLDPRDRQAMGNWLMGGLAANPQIRAAIVYDSSQAGWSVHRATGVLKVENASRAAPADVARAFADAATRAEPIYWGEVVHVAGTSMINLRARIPWPGGGDGMLVAAISLEELSRHMATVSGGIGWTGFILLGRDRVLAHPYLVEHPQALSAQHPTLPLAALPDPALPRIWQGTASGQFRIAAERGVEVRQDASNGPEYIYVVGRADRFGDRPWYFGAYSPIGAVNEEFERAMISGAIALVLAAVGGLVAVWIGRRLARPLRRSAAAAGRIGRLEVDDIERLPMTGVRELDQQAEAFNRMLEALRMFATYVPRQLVVQLAARGFTGEVPSATEDVTVLFTDIAGFTSAVEHLTAAETADLLNRHFSLLGEAVHVEGGIIDKYVGDSLMAFWAKPLVDEDAPVRAVAAAARIAAALADDNRARQAAGQPAIRVRIGIHTGPALVGNIGAVGRVNFTVVGDTVNVAQRLQEFGRQVDGQAECVVSLSEDVEASLPADIGRDPVGAVSLRGRAAPVAVWRLRTEPQALTGKG